MSQQRVKESPAKMKHYIVCRESRPTTSQPVRVGLHSIPQMQRALGNQRMAQLIRAGLFNPQGKTNTAAAKTEPYSSADSKTLDRQRIE